MKWEGTKENVRDGEQESAQEKVRETDRQQEEDKGSWEVRSGAREQAAIFRWKESNQSPQW